MRGEGAAAYGVTANRKAVNSPAERKTSKQTASRMPRAGIRPYPALAEQRFGIADAPRLRRFAKLASPRSSEDWCRRPPLQPNWM